MNKCLNIKHEFFLLFIAFTLQCEVTRGKFYLETMQISLFKSYVIKQFLALIDISLLNSTVSHK